MTSAQYLNDAVCLPPLPFPPPILTSSLWARLKIQGTFLKTPNVFWQKDFVGCCCCFFLAHWELRYQWEINLTQLSHECSNGTVGTYHGRIRPNLRYRVIECILSFSHRNLVKGVEVHWTLACLWCRVVSFFFLALSMVLKGFLERRQEAWRWSDAPYVSKKKKKTNLHDWDFCQFKLDVRQKDCPVREREAISFPFITFNFIIIKAINAFW